MKSKEIVKQKILARIESGRYAAGGKIDPVSQLSREFSVSPVTVTMAMRDLTEQGLVRTEPRVGCFVRERPGAAEHEARPSQRGRIGILLPFLEGVKLFSSGAASDALRAIQSALYSQPYHIEIIRGGIPTAFGIRPPYVSPDALADGHFSALIAIGFYDLGYLYSVRKVVPVMIALDVDASAIQVDSVFFDQTRSAAELTRRLHAEGRRAIAFVGGECGPLSALDAHQFDPAARERRAGWRAAMVALNQDPDAGLVLEMPRGTQAEGPEIVARFVAERRPDAIVTEFPDKVFKGLDRVGGEAQELPVACWTDDPAPQEIRARAAFCASCDLARGVTPALEVLRARIAGERMPIAQRAIPVTILAQRQDAREPVAAGLAGGQ